MDSTLERYNAIFRQVFGVEENEYPNLVFRAHVEWNSMAHIALIAALEEEFDVEFDVDDIFSFSSYENGKVLLKTRFGLEIN